MSDPRLCVKLGLCPARAATQSLGMGGHAIHNPIAEVSEIIPSDDLLLLKIPIRRIIPRWDRDQPLPIRRAELLAAVVQSPIL